MSFLITAIDASVVEYQHGHRQAVTTNGFNLHSAEPESAIALDSEHLLSTRYGRTDAISHTDAHYTPRTCIETQAWMIHIHDIAGIVEGIGSFVHQVDVLIVLQHIANHLQGIEIVHGLGRCFELGLHLGCIGLLHGVDAVHPCLATVDIERFHLTEHQVERGTDIAHYRSFDFAVAVHLIGTDVQLNELDIGIPFLTLTMVQEPIEPCSYQHDHIRLTKYQATGRSCALGMVVGQYTFGHGHREERNTSLFDKFFQRFFGLRISRSLTDDNQWFGCIAEEFQGPFHRCRAGQLNRCRIDRRKE